jgi:hypothetical protein
MFNRHHDAESGGAIAQVDIKERLLGVKDRSSSVPNWVRRITQPTRLFVISSVFTTVVLVSSLLLLFVAVPAYMQFLVGRI